MLQRVRALVHCVDVTEYANIKWIVRTSKSHDLKMKIFWETECCRVCRSFGKGSVLEGWRSCSTLRCPKLHDKTSCAWGSRKWTTLKQKLWRRVDVILQKAKTAVHRLGTGWCQNSSSDKRLDSLETVCERQWLKGGSSRWKREQTMFWRRSRTLRSWELSGEELGCLHKHDVRVWSSDLVDLTIQRLVLGTVVWWACEMMSFGSTLHGRCFRELER